MPVPLKLNEVHIFENTGGEPLELMIIGVSRDSSRKITHERAESSP